VPAHVDDALDHIDRLAQQDDPARTGIVENCCGYWIIVQDLVQHIATAEWLAGQLADTPLQTQQVERKPIAQMRFTVSVDLRMRPQHMAQHRRVAAHVAQDEER